jgi:RHS repeat-associated protein
MPKAARVGDPIAHTSALTGFLAGAVIGIALIATVAFATFTCGFGVALLAGVMAGVGAAGILGLGEAIGRMFTSQTGAITLGSRNVFINGKPAAFATASTVACSKHNPVPLIAEGSGNVFINGLPAARLGDAITCGAKIDDGSSNVFIGGGTVRYMEVEDEVPPWLRTAVDWAFALAGLVGGLAGLLRQAGGCSRALFPCAAKFIAGFVIGEAVGRTVIGPAISRVFGGQAGHPVDVTTGRKLLLATDEVDFTLQSPVPLQCGRFYASNLSHVGSLGAGWVLPWELRLERREGHIWLIDAQGRETGFPLVQPGHSAFSDVEQKYLACTAEGRYILYDLNELYFDFGPMAAGDGDDVALLQRIEDQCGQWLAFRRDADTGSDSGSPNIRFIMTSGGQQLRLSYLNIKGRLTEIELTHNRKRCTLVKYGYDNDGQLTSVTDAAGNVTRRFAYTDGLMVSHINALGFECRYRWETIAGQPRVVQMGTSEGENALFSYDPQARQTKMVDELGRSAQWTYDEHFQVIECIDLDGKRYGAEYTESGMPTVLHLPAEDGQERTVRFDYDEAGRIVSETDVLGRTTTTRYHHNSIRPAAVTLPDGSQWIAEYDHLGRLLKTTDPLGREETCAYPEASASPWPIERSDAKGGKKVLEWSRSGQLVSYTDCSNKTTRYAYDLHGRVVEITNALEHTTRIERLPTGQPKAIELPDGSRETFEHDAAGLLVAHHDRAGHTRQWQRNNRGQVLKATDAAGRNLDYRYDAQGRLIELSSATGAYAFGYDAGDRLVRETRPDGVQRQLRYGAFGQAIALTEVGADAGGQAPTRTAHFERDNAARLLTQSNDTSSTAYTWDDGDRLIEAKKQPTEAGKMFGVNASTVSFQYDKAGRLIAEKGADGRVRYELDELDNLATLHLPHEQRIDYLSYGSGHVHQVRCGEHLIADIERDDLHREVMRTQGKLTLGLNYDALGRRTWQSAATDAAAIGPGQGKLWRTYRYSAQGELAEQADNTRGALQFEYDPAGQMLRRSKPDGRTDLERFAWDAAGNLLDEIQRKSAGRVEGNRLQMWQDIRFEYDAWGNLKTKLSGHRQTQHFTFDAENRLISVKTEIRGGRIETSFEYDALGRRIAKVEKHIEISGRVSPEQTRRFVWQGLRMVQELRETGLSNYIYSADSPYTPMARVDAYTAPMPVTYEPDSHGVMQPVQAKVRPRVLHFHTDLVGAPMEVTDEVGDLAWVGDYTAWGKVKKDTKHAFEARIEQPLRYPGQYEDDSTGLHFNTFRYYDPDMGRFINHDPIGLVGGENLYAYAPNPTGWMDPLGLAFGGVDFTGSPGLFPVQAGQSNVVEIAMQGSRPRDFVEAWKQSGISPSQAPDYTWHHVRDFNPETGKSTMQLVSKDAHRATYPHAGSVEQYEKAFKVKYGSPESVRVAESKGWLTGRKPAPRTGSGC